jgi:hypothetical protein
MLRNDPSDGMSSAVAGIDGRPGQRPRANGPVPAATRRQCSAPPSFVTAPDVVGNEASRETNFGAAGVRHRSIDQFSATGDAVESENLHAAGGRL